MKICCIGTGYVGLVTGTCFAEAGHYVTCVDIDENKINMLNQGKIPIYEPGLNDMVSRNIQAGRLKFSTQLSSGFDAYFIGVGTPESEDGSANMQFVYTVAEQLGKIIDNYTVIVDKSTVPTETGKQVEKIIKQELAKRNLQIPFAVVSCPEFLREGLAIEDFMKPDRVVIGTDDAKARQVMKEIYQTGVLGQHIADNKILFMGRESAETVKYGANTFLAARISLINEISRLCSAVGANVHDVALGIGTDSRIGPQFLQAGHGYGGSCFPKDVKALEFQMKQRGLNCKLIESISKSNYEQKFEIPNQISKVYGSNLEGKNFALWGLAFKADTDDVRESSALIVAERLKAMSATVTAFDPEALENAKQYLETKSIIINYSVDQYEALNDADALILATEWSQFYDKADWVKVKEKLKHPIIFDGKNICASNPELRKTLQELGFTVYSIGIPTIK